jgi:hypothetical protein
LGCPSFHSLIMYLFIIWEQLLPFWIRFNIFRLLLTIYFVVHTNYFNNNLLASCHFGLSAIVSEGNINKYIIKLWKLGQPNVFIYLISLTRNLFWGPTPCCCIFWHYFRCSWHRKWRQQWITWRTLEMVVSVVFLRWNERYLFVFFILVELLNITVYTFFS